MKMNRLGIMCATLIGLTAVTTLADSSPTPGPSGSPGALPGDPAVVGMLSNITTTTVTYTAPTGITGTTTPSPATRIRISRRRSRAGKSLVARRTATTMYPPLTRTEAMHVKRSAATVRLYLFTWRAAAASTARVSRRGRNG